LQFQKEVKSGFKWTGISMVGGSLLQFLQIVILARILSPEEFGLFSLALVFIRFCNPLIELGFGSAVIQKQDISKTELSTLFWINLILGVLFFLILQGTAGWFSGFFEETFLKELLPFIAIGFLIAPWGFQQQALLQKHFVFNLLTIANLSSIAIDFVVSIVLALKGFGVWSLAYGYLAKVLVSALLHFLFGFFSLRSHPSWQFDWKASKKLIRFGFFETGSLLTNYISANIDKLIIGKLLGTAALGIYTIIWELIMVPLGRLNPIFTKIAFPVFSKIQEDSNVLKSWYEKLSKVVVLVNTPIYLMLAYLSYETLLHFYGAEWISGSGVLSWMAVVGWIKSISNPGAVVILARGRSEVGFYWNLGWAILIGILLYGFISWRPDLISVGWAQFLGLAISIWIYHLAVSRVGNFSYERVLKNISIGLVWAILALVPISVIHSFGIFDSFWGFLLSIGLFSGIYVWIVLTFEKRFIKDLISEYH
jgi:O-antigen/teichoic acid export membrane protein